MKQHNDWSRRQFLGATGLGAAALAVPGCVHKDTSLTLDSAPNSYWKGIGVKRRKMQAAIEFMDEEFEKGSFPGASLVATRNERLFLEEYRGTYCDGKTRDVPVDGSVINMVYSFSKVVTATVVVMAHQDGLVDYDAPVSEYLPGFEAGGKEKITLRHCLTHSAGIPTPPLTQVLTEEQWQKNVETVCKHELEWEPGSKTLYHGLSGKFVAAACVKAASGNKPWNDICRERLFDPIGAKTMTFGLPPEGAPVAYTPQPKELPFPTSLDQLGMAGHPGGGCFARVDDMLRLLQLHLNGGVWKGKRLIKKDAFEEMHRVQYAAEIEAAIAAGKKPAHEYWALGWLTRGKTETGWFGFGNVVSEQAYGHAGINTVIGIADPATGLAMAFLTTDVPKSDAETIRLRNTATNLVASALV